jgi:uncharacterized membrane protein
MSDTDSGASRSGTPEASPWIGVASGSVVLGIAALFIAIKGNWKLLLFILLVTLWCTLIVVLQTSRRRGRISVARARLLTQVAAFAFVVSAVTLGWIVSGP